MRPRWFRLSSPAILTWRPPRRLVLEIERARRRPDRAGRAVFRSDGGRPRQSARARRAGSRPGLRSRRFSRWLRELRKETEIPIILFGYFNPIYPLRMRADRAPMRAQAGIDGLLVVDIPPEESRRTGETRARKRPRSDLSARADHADRARRTDRALRQRLSLLCIGDRRDRRAHPAGSDD